MNRFDSYMRGAKLARMLAQEGMLAHRRGDDRKALGYMIGAFNSLLTATNNFAHLQFHPRKKNPLGLKRAKLNGTNPGPVKIDEANQKALGSLSAVQAALKDAQL